MWNLFKANKEGIRTKYSDVALVSLLLTFNRFHTLVCCFHLWLWASKCLDGCKPNLHDLQIKVISNRNINISTTNNYHTPLLNSSLHYSKTKSITFTVFWSKKHSYNTRSSRSLVLFITDVPKVFWTLTEKQWNGVCCSNLLTP